MSNIINEELRAIINDPSSLKVIASVNCDGELHVVYKQSLHAEENGELEFYEVIESSQNNKNFVNAIWFDRLVAVNVLTADKRSFEIKGKVKKAYVAGSYFEQKYTELVNSGYYDLSTVWRIEPVSAEEKTFAVREEAEKTAHPHFRHLDRLTK